MLLMRSAALAVLLAGAAIQAAAQAPDPARITVSGQGEAAATPDMATITVGVRESADTAVAAMDAASGVADRILSRLAEFNIGPRDMQTAQLTLNPIWGERDTPRREPPIVGYEATNTVSVRVRDLDRLGAVLGAVLGDGANTLNGLEFAVADPEPLLTEARRRAVADARKRAETYAAAAGVTLGSLRQISEAGGGGMPRPMAMTEMRMAAADVPVAAGETGYSAQVTLVYDIAE